jgi:ectoine hydroxylase-related dioxygenase (phytanoyl-CoA dioxygenase family)
MLQTSLPDLTHHYLVSAEQIDAFQRTGHVLLRGVASAELIAAYRDQIVEAVLKYDQESELIEQIAAGRQNGWRFVHNLWERDQACGEFVRAPRFAQIAADLLGVPTLRLLRDESYFKEPGAMATPWHQDCDFFPLDTDRVISMWIALSDISSDMAPMTFASGSHRGGYFTPEATEQPFGLSGEALVRSGFPLVNHGPMAAGDATFHAGWTLHCSGQNLSDRRREALVVVYFQDGARIWLPDSMSPAPNYLQGCPKDILRQQHLARCFPGLAVGDLAASVKNPLVYARSSGGLG